MIVFSDMPAWMAIVTAVVAIGGSVLILIKMIQSLRGLGQRGTPSIGRRSSERAASEATREWRDSLREDAAPDNDAGPDNESNRSGDR